MSDTPLQSGLGVGESALVQLAAGGALEVSGASGGGGAVNLPDEGTIVAPPVAADWTLVNMSLATLVDSGVSGQPTVYLSDFADGASDNTRCAFLANPGAGGNPYTLKACLRLGLLNTSSEALGAGLVIQNAAGLQIAFQYVQSGAGCLLQVVQRVSAAVFHANVSNVGENFSLNARVWLGIQVTGGSRKYLWYPDGQNPVTVLEEANTNWIPNDETLLGFMVNLLTSSGSPGVAATLESWETTSP
jgi:hypothetical protein